MNKQELRNETWKFTEEKQRKYRKVINPITSQIQAALILYKLKTGNKWQSDTAQLSYDEDWKISESKRKDSPKKWAVDILWNIEEINIINIRNKAYSKIDESKIIEKSDKEHLKSWIRDFIRKNFIISRIDLENKKHLPHKRFRKYYTLLSKKLVKEWKMSPKEWILYNDICLALANILYDKNHDYIDKEWQITQWWLEYIWRVFLKTIKNIPNSWSSKSFHKIFHDWDFNFLRKENSRWEPIIWTLDHYVKAIMYLMEPNSFNAYEEWWPEWANEWYKSRKSFLNNLYTTINLREEHTKWSLSDKWIIHKKLTEQRTSSKEWLKDSQNWDLTARYKTDASKMLKIWWRTKEIKDESWIRATFYWEEKAPEEIKNSIIALCKNYLDKISNTKWIYIESIQADKKWDFIDEKTESEILNELEDYLSGFDDENIEITKRVKTWNKSSKIDSISQIYRSLNQKNPSQWMKQAYKIASWEVKRWANGKYEDFKLIVKYTINKDEYNEWSNGDKIDEDVSLYQEISFYPHSNDLGIWNHNFLDLEKRIFNRVKNMTDPELWKSISFNRLRYFTESTLKDISFDIDIYEDKIKRWVLPQPKNDDYKYLVIDGKKLPLDWLVYRTKENTYRFDELIPLILNYFIKKNKIFYINKESDWFHWLITDQQLHDKNTYKIRRFSTSDTLKNTALDTNNEWYSICFYSEDKKWYWYPNFYVINLWDLWDFISLEKLT
jgi:hypothetical protein